MVTWGSPFVSIALKTLGLFNIFLFEKLGIQLENPSDSCPWIIQLVSSPLTLNWPLILWIFFFKILFKKKENHGI